MMRDYILYHNATDMEYDLEGNDVNGIEEEGLNYGSNFYTSTFFDTHFTEEDDEFTQEPKWEYFAGNEEAEVEDFEFSIVTNNKEATESIGQRVWVIQGEAHTVPREYYLHGYFVPQYIERRPTKIGGKTFKYRIYGDLDYIVLPLKDSYRLNGEFWFIGFRKHFMNFKKGFRQIEDSGFVAELEDCLDKINY